MTSPAPAASYWQREARWRDQWSHGALPRAVDFAIIGGGFAGLATAIRLRELHPGADVLLLEAQRVGYGASGRNAGFLSPVAAPVWLLGAERSPDQAWATRRLNEEVHATARWLAEHVPGAELRAASLSLEAVGRLSEAGLGEFARALAHAGLEHQLLDSRVRPGHRVVAMDAYTVHPYQLVRGLAEHAVRLGVRIRERAPVRGLEPAPAGARVRVDGEPPVLARRVIVCTNAYTSSLELGERVRALVVRSFLMASAPLAPAAVQQLVRDGDFAVELNRAQGFHRLHADRLLYGGADQLRAAAGCDFAVPAGVRSHLLRLQAASFPSLADLAGLAASEAWAGSFHATATGLPIIRPSTTNPAVVFNMGYGGTGVALALVCARLVAAVASGEPPASAEDARLLAVMQETRLSVRDTLRAMGRVLASLARPWRAP